MRSKADLSLINDGQHANSEFLAAAMIWPDDFSRGNHLTVAAIRNLADMDNDPTAASLFQSRNEEIRKALWRGFVTGKVFTATLAGLSLGKAQFLAERTMDGVTFDGRRRSLSAESARLHWRAYKNVSHLWAAYTMIQGTPDERDFNLLVQLGGTLLNLALQNGGFPEWKPVVVETDLGPFLGEVKIPKIDERTHPVLKSYQPRSSF